MAVIFGGTFPSSLEHTNSRHPRKVVEYGTAKFIEEEQAILEFRHIWKQMDLYRNYKEYHYLEYRRLRREQVKEILLEEEGLD